MPEGTEGQGQDPKNQPQDPENPTNPEGGEGEGGSQPQEPPKEGKGGDLNKALNQSRYETRKEKEAREAAEKELAEYKKKEAEREEANLKRKGEYEKLSQNLKTKNEALEAENAELKKFKETWETNATARIEKMKEGLPEDSLELLNATLEGKTLQQQEDLLPKLVDRFKVPSNINTPPKGGGTPDSEHARKLSELQEKKEKAKQDKDSKAVLKYDTEIQKLQQEK